MPPQTLIWSLLIKLIPWMRTSWQSTNEDLSDLEWRFIPMSNNTCGQTALTVSPWTPKSSSSLLTRLDNPVWKAGILFAQWLLSTLIVSDLMRDCRLLVDSGQPHSVMAMAKQQRETKQDWALVPVITRLISASLLKTLAAMNIICCLNYSYYCLYFNESNHSLHTYVKKYTQLPINQVHLARTNAVLI